MSHLGLSDDCYPRGVISGSFEVEVDRMMSPMDFETSDLILYIVCHNDLVWKSRDFESSRTVKSMKLRVFGLRCLRSAYPIGCRKTLTLRDLG
jgi:hypothetical protein